LQIALFPVFFKIIKVLTRAFAPNQMLGLFIVGIHLPNYLNSGDEEMRHLALMNMLKDTALTGFSMHIAAGAHHQHLHIEEEAD
jgi:hypothetical protein